MKSQLNHEQVEDQIGSVLNEHRILRRLIDEHKHDVDVVEKVIEKLSNGEFKLGDSAAVFFNSCLNEVVLARMENELY